MGCGCFGKNVAPTSTTVTTYTSTVPVVSPQVVTQATLPNSGLPTNTPIVKSTGYNVLDMLQDKLTGKLKYVSKDVVEFRMIQCHSCEHLKIGLCSQCGCIVDFKTRYEQSVCPVGKW